MLCIKIEKQNVRPFSIKMIMSRVHTHLRVINKKLPERKYNVFIEICRKKYFFKYKEIKGKNTDTCKTKMHSE